MLSVAYMELKNKLSKDLLSLACRYHINELVLKHSFEAACGPSSGPDIPMLKNNTFLKKAITAKHSREEHAEL